MPTSENDKTIITPVDKKLEKAAVFLLAILWIAAIAGFILLPTIIPTHYNFKGEVDGYGSKQTIFILPLIGTVIFIGITVLSKKPHLYNYPVRITPENKYQQFEIASRMLRTLKASILFVFLLITVITFLHTRNLVKGLSWLFLPLLFVLIFIPVAVQLRKSFLNK